VSLVAGSRLGAYEIHFLLGAGVMGEVYRARDTVLKRQVALKILPPTSQRILNGSRASNAKRKWWPR
jgi:serine/threonine protein kinase